MASNQIGSTLLRSGLITQDQLDRAIREQGESHLSLSVCLTKLKILSEQELADFLARHFNTTVVNLDSMTPDQDVLSLVPPDVAERYQVLPVKRRGKELTLAMPDPSDLMAIEDIRFITGLDVIPVVATESDLKQALAAHYPHDGSKMELQPIQDDFEPEMFDESMDLEVLEAGEEGEEADISRLIADGRSTPIVSLVNFLITDAVLKGASDIHVEPYERVLRARFRIDGILREVMSPPFRLKDAIVSRVKIMTGSMDIAERRVPQDGRIKVVVKDRLIDLRVSIIPTIYGEKCVMRILDKSALMLDMKDLGFEPQDLERFEKAIAKPYGIVLVTGPTGSGKSTTLYSALNKLNREDTHILTVEEPVEYNLAGINQVQVHEEIGLTFAAALRAFLRQSPNIIMVGEIRDSETAEIAIRAALTGHLVLSTIHTNDAPSTINRLIDMGIEPFLVASSLNLIQAQRLVRKICGNCKTAVEPDYELLRDAGINPDDLDHKPVYRGEGCQECEHTGYKGRVGIFEVMDVTPEIRELILKGVSSAEIREASKQQTMATLREDAMKKLKRGVITLDEVVRETGSM
jgi:type IV pilus assembly protein PilB